jgi:hypothetical protein
MKLREIFKTLTQTPLKFIIRYAILSDPKKQQKSFE